MKLKGKNTHSPKDAGSYWFHDATVSCGHTAFYCLTEGPERGLGTQNSCLLSVCIWDAALFHDTMYSHCVSCQRGELFVLGATFPYHLGILGRPAKLPVDKSSHKFCAWKKRHAEWTKVLTCRGQALHGFSMDHGTANPMSKFSREAPALPPFQWEKLSSPTQPPKLVCVQKWYHSVLIWPGFHYCSYLSNWSASHTKHTSTTHFFVFSGGGEPLIVCWVFRSVLTVITFLLVCQPLIRSTSLQTLYNFWRFAVHFWGLSWGLCKCTCS